MGLVYVAARGQAGAPANETRTTIVMPPAPLLPKTLGTRTSDDEVAQGWDETSSGSGDFFDPATCAPMRKNAATPPSPCHALLLEDGLKRTASRAYKSKAGGSAVEVWAEQFGDATGAYSAYTFYRNSLNDPRPLISKPRIGNEAVTAAGQTLVWAATALLHFVGPLSEGDLAALVAGLPKVGGRRGLAPLLPTMVPNDRLQAESVRYAIGPVGYEHMNGVLPVNLLSWDKSVEVVTAAYAGREGKGTLTLLLCPTPQIAGDQGRVIERFVNTEIARTQGALGTVKMRRVGPLLGITSGTWSAERATAVLGDLKLNEEVTFDKKMPLEFHAEVRKTATLLQSIAIFTGVLILAAVVLGVFLGGLRAGIRVLQGKPAASEPEFLTINLRDKPKALFRHQDPGKNETAG